MKIGVLGASFDTGNMGVSVLAAGTVQNALRQYPDAELYFLNYGRQAEAVTVGSGAQKTIHRLVPLRFSKYLVQRNNIFLLLAAALVCKMIPGETRRMQLLRRNRVFGEIYDTDLFVSIAGGDSFSDIYGIRRLLYVGLPQFLVLLCGRRLALLPQTIGPFHSRLGARFAKLILRGAEKVYCRDHAGVETTRKFASLNGNYGEKVKFSYDLGFQVAPASVGIISTTGLSTTALQKDAVVGLNISGLLWHQGDRFGLALDYRQLVTECLRHFIEVEKVRVLLVPHVVCPGNIDNDAEAIQEVSRRYALSHPGMVEVVDGGLSYDQTKYVIGLCDYFLGARMHACIAALSQGVPCSAMAYSGKFEGVMDSVGAESITIDLRRVDLESALRSIAQNYQQRSELRCMLGRTMPEVRKAVALL